mgnify:CR=1 FL=1
MFQPFDPRSFRKPFLPFKNTYQKDNPNFKGKPFEISIGSSFPRISSFLFSEEKLVREISDVEIAPCWTLLLAFDSPLKLNFDAWNSDIENIVWIARNSSKPKRDETKECWVVHASPKWSKSFLEIKNDQATQLLLGELRSIFGSSFSNASYKASHRWRYARTIRPLMKTYLCSADKSLDDTTSTPGKFLTALAKFPLLLTTKSKLLGVLYLRPRIFPFPARVLKLFQNFHVL